MTEQEAARILQALTFNIVKRNLPKDAETINMALKAVAMGITTLEEIQQYRAIGTVENVKEYKEIADNMDAVDMGTLCVALRELKKYQSIGTVEECREALKKQKMKRPLYDKENRVLKCPNCKSYLQAVINEDGLTEGPMPRYCKSCGQKISPYWNAGK